MNLVSLLRRSLIALSLVALAGCGRAQSNFKSPIPQPKDAKGNFFEPPSKAVSPFNNWMTKDPMLDGFEGTSADRAYTELKLPAGREIIVAVIDSGVDINHEDLQGHIWTNKGEIPGNGIDDDNNGFVDDIHGWNFLGSYDANGAPTHVDATTLEVTRELVRMKKLKAEREAKGETLTKDEAAYLDKVNTEVTSSLSEAKNILAIYTELKENLEQDFVVLKPVMDIEFSQVTIVALKALESSDPAVVAARDGMISNMESVKLADTARLLRVIASYNSRVKYYYNEAWDSRKTIIGDNPADYQDMNYGNNDVKGPDAFHGTHVSGIIGALRGNGIGIDGIATNVKIMALRAVPDGDEYDKDIANSVIYAANNGAQVINMSFGKSYSPGKSRVDEAFKYAAARGVLIIHSAGNDGRVTTKEDNFPNRYVMGPVNEEIPGWIEVGASSAYKGLELPASFSNYGKTSVDIFGPGVQIYSTVPDDNQYAFASGTSMAGPAVAGVAALIRSQVANLTAEGTRNLILRTARQYPDLTVLQPGDAQRVPFDSLSTTGGIADAFTALSAVR